MASESFIVRLHDTPEDPQLADLRDAGQEFVATSFQERHFLNAFYGNMPAGCEPAIVSVREASSGRLAMMLPLLLRKTSAMRFIEAVDLGLADYVAPAVARWFAPSREQMEAIWKQLRQALPAADVLTLKKIPALLPEGVPNPLLLLPGTVPMGTGTKTILLDDEAGEDHYLKSGIYKDGMRKLRKLRKEGDVQFRLAQTGEEADALFAHMLRQRLVRFEALGRPDALTEPWVQAFYRQLATEGVPAGKALFGGLYLDGRCIGTDFGLLYADTHHRILTSLESGEAERFSPGTIAFMLILDETRSRGIPRYDLGVGELGYKNRLSGTMMEVYERHEALSLRGQVAVAEAAGRRMIRHGIARYPQLRQPAETVRQRLRQLRR